MPQHGRATVFPIHRQMEKNMKKLYNKVCEVIDTNEWQVLIKPHQAVFDKIKDDEKLKGVL